MSSDTKVSKLKEAERLAKHGEISQALKLYKELCFGRIRPTPTPSTKVAAIISLFTHISSEGPEYLTKMRDMLSYAGKERDNMIEVLTLLGMSSEIPIFERSITAQFLYNKAYINESYKCFKSIALEPSSSAPRVFRVEACKYLFASEDEENRSTAQEVLLEITATGSSETSSDRYKIIASFISSVGITSYLNKSKIRVAYDENFVYGLQHAFFYCEQNGMRERILSGQHLLQMSCVNVEEKKQVGEHLLIIAGTSSLDENIRADAADVILRHGIDDQRLRARDIITQMGHSTVKTNVRTLYNNSQNMHDETIGKSIEKIIEELITDPNIRVVPFDRVKEEASRMIRGSDIITRDLKFKAYRALDRIEIDTATYTKKNATLAEIFVHVWLRVKQKEGSVREMLEKRMIEELVEMGDTCATGHAGRFVNVLSGVDVDITISFESQLVANVVGRLGAKIRNIVDVKRREQIKSGMATNADEKDREIYLEYVDAALAEIRSELYDEFVKEQYITEEMFDAYFEKARKQWMEE